MSNETMRDSSGEFQCPYCGSVDSLEYTEIPSSVRTYEIGYVEHVDHFGPSRDYRCRNCGHEWNQAEAQP